MDAGIEDVLFLTQRTWIGKLHDTPQNIVHHADMQ